jgi:hypothetical protein
MKILKYFFILLCLGLTGCRSFSGSEKVLDINTMKLVMWDLLKADEWYVRKSLIDSTVKKKKENIGLYDKVFGIHGISKNQFYFSYKYYESHPIEYKTLLDSVESFGNRERNNLMNMHTK